MTPPHLRQPPVLPARWVRIDHPGARNPHRGCHRETWSRSCWRRAWRARGPGAERRLTGLRCPRPACCTRRPRL